MLIAIKHKDGESFVNITCISEITSDMTSFNRIAGKNYNIDKDEIYYCIYTADGSTDGRVIYLKSSEINKIDLVNEINKAFRVSNSSVGSSLVSIFKSSKNSED